MKNMEFACPNCMDSGLIIERVVVLTHEVFDIKENDGRIVDWKVDKDLHSNVDKKVTASCVKCGNKVGSFLSIKELLNHLLETKQLIDVDEAI